MSFNSSIGYQAKSHLSSTEPITLQDNTTQISSLANGHLALINMEQRIDTVGQETSTKLLSTPIDGIHANDRPHTRDSELERYKEGSGHDVPDLNFRILIDAIGKDGSIMKVLALIDTGSDTSCATDRGSQRIRGTLKVEAVRLPKQFQRTYTNPISKSTWKPIEYLGLRVRGGTVGIPETIVNLALLDNIGSDSEDTSFDRNSLSDVAGTKPDIILGCDFIKRHHGLLVQIVDANSQEFHAALQGSSIITPSSMFAPIQEDKKSKEQKAADKAKNEEITKKGREKAKELLVLLENTKPK